MKTCDVCHCELNEENVLQGKCFVCDCSIDADYYTKFCMIYTLLCEKKGFSRVAAKNYAHDLLTHVNKDAYSIRAMRDVFGF
jgi:hypothetical protein